MSEIISQTVTDSAGRKLEVKQLNAVEMLDLYEAAGVLCSNGAWLGTALIACSVRAIDGTPVVFPVDKKGVKNLVGKIEMHGIAAAREGLSADDDAEDADADAMKELAKN